MGECVKEIFKPAWWCRGAHAQTLFGALFRSKLKTKLNRKRLELPDGDFLDLDFLETSSTNGRKAAPLVVILHGLEGSSQALYVRSLLGTIYSAGWNSVAVNMRMCSGTPNRLKQTYHSGKTEDLEWVLCDLIEREERERIYLVGYSVGGNILLKWLGERGGSVPQEIQKAAAISVPYDLSASVELMDRGFNRLVYTRTLLASLKAKIHVKEKQFPDVVRYDVAKRSTTFREFDREITAPLNGFRSEVNYWTETSCKDFLKSITVPTLLIHAEDDPFFPGNLFPFDTIRGSKHLTPLVIPCGGHLGFIAGRWPWKQELWLERRIMEFFSMDRQLIEHSHAANQKSV
jgi:predicted alpha/beta-fold hydrolase